jgi:hypothetical protein
MPEKLHAGKAGRSTPIEDPFGGFQHDEYRLKAVESRHEAVKKMANTRELVGLGKVAILAVVVLCAMALDVPMPWTLVLSAFLGR